MATTEERIAELEERLRELEIERESAHGRNPFRMIREISDEIVPVHVRRHMLAARRENMLAFRAYLDRAIARVESAAARIAPRDQETL